MKVISYRREDGTESVGFWRNELNGPYDLLRAIELSSVAMDECPPLLSNMLDLLDAGFLDVDVLAEVDDFVEEHNLVYDLSDADDFKILAPIARPRTIYALGRNYPAMPGNTARVCRVSQIVFAKASTAVIGPQEKVIYKKWLTRIDPEAELAVIIGMEGSNIPEEEARSYIAGYTIVNDVTARDLQSADIEKSAPGSAARESTRSVRWARTSRFRMKSLFPLNWMSRCA